MVLNLVNTHIYFNVFTTIIALLLKKVYALYSIEIFNSGLNCSFQKKCFFSTTGFIKLIISTFVTIIVNFKNLLFVEYFMSGFNCSYQRKVFRNTTTDIKYALANWDVLGDEVIGNYTGSIDSIVFIIKLAESKLMENFTNCMLCISKFVFTFTHLIIKNIYLLPFIITLTISIVFIFLMKKQIFVFNKPTDIIKTSWKNVKICYRLYEQFSKFK